MSGASADASGPEVGIVEGAARAPCDVIRQVVFVEEQGVDREEEWDGLDATSVHFLATLAGVPVGTARMRCVDGAAKVERVAVLAHARRAGVGRALMAALEREASRRAWAPLRLHAQQAAIPFYESLGYLAEGPVFHEAGIPHRRMEKGR